MKTKPEETKPEQSHHYYATTAHGWGVGPTRQAAIAKAASQSDGDTIKRLVRQDGGMYVWTCRVDLPESARYSISYYKPETQKENGEPVPLSHAREYLLMNTKGHVTVAPDEYERVERKIDEAKEPVVNA